MISCLIIAHGKMARGLINAASVIVGEQEGVYLLSNSEYSLDTLKTEIRKVLENAGECIIFVDCLGSSYAAARMASGGWPVVSGINLPMLLSFFTKRERMGLEELLEAVLTDGKKGILFKR